MDELFARLRYTTAEVDSPASLDVPGRRVAGKLLELADRFGAERGETTETSCSSPSQS